ncbi:MAG: hypothetical protein AB1394_15375 [Bacteroidota bacterium]
MNYYLSKLTTKIKNKKANILFIGQNDFATEQAINLSVRGFQVYFYNEKSISNIEDLINNKVHLTTLVYDVFDVDVIVFSKPKSIKNDEISPYLADKLQWVNQFFHAGILVVVDEDLSKLLEKPIKNALEFAAYDDPASPLIQSFKVNENYFYLEFDPKAGKETNSDNEEVVSLVKKFLNFSDV